VASNREIFCRLFQLEINPKFELLGIILNMDYFMTVCYNFYFTNICQFKIIFFLVNSYLYLLIFISCIPKATICEIRAGRWVRNGSQIRSQVQLYVNCHFCNSMLDLDIFLLQVSQSALPF